MPDPKKKPARAPASTLSISSRNYSSWSLRGWLLVRFAGLDVQAQVIAHDDQSRQELLLLSPSILVPCLTHEGVKVWDTLAIGEYLNETCPKAGCCRPIASHVRIAGRSPARCTPASAACGGAADESARALPKYKIWARAQGDIERSRRSGASASKPMAGPTCSAPSAAWPMRCMPRCARAAPMT
jgi:glutathione S-transferase